MFQVNNCNKLILLAFLGISCCMQLAGQQRRTEKWLVTSEYTCVQEAVWLLSCLSLFLKVLSVWRSLWEMGELPVSEIPYKTVKGNIDVKSVPTSHWLTLHIWIRIFFLYPLHKRSLFTEGVNQCISSDWLISDYILVCIVSQPL